MRCGNVLILSRARAQVYLGALRPPSNPPITPPSTSSRPLSSYTTAEPRIHRASTPECYNTQQNADEVVTQYAVAREVAETASMLVEVNNEVFEYEKAREGAVKLGQKDREVMDRLREKVQALGASGGRRGRAGPMVGLPCRGGGLIDGPGTAALACAGC
ncbi:uncharacterized protein CC84DRAFT_1209792 [Paraphaeosphaeria sporulosa]|uniref:Uncharacterized protein n=1 Tax=Paraphaeosphaeria sporulosa TaxID=1460663 RepID=A0A177BX91_9PLEO|nr:uncharacterized protein CC84DRAFT_1209792 [Paraphaeosphaeria sporulosa]OAG00124.1 hypothetical protein CC84DRAFT_1209792 [Paraphaeosphaeria sporulosa]